MTWDDLRKQLSVPFPAGVVKFRPGAQSSDKKRAQALAYAEPRVYEDRLNEVIGPNWSCRFIPWGDKRLLCELTITVDDAGGVRELVRTSTGEFDAGDTIAQGTAAEAQAFKRACSKFGLGRYLYDLPVVWVGYDPNSRRLTEIPGVPERYLPQPQPVTPPEPVRLNASRASQLHRELGKLLTIASKEHSQIAADALAHEVETFTGLTEPEALAVLNHARKVDARRCQERHVNPERREQDGRMRA